MFSKSDSERLRSAALRRLRPTAPRERLKTSPVPLLAIDSFLVRLFTTADKSDTGRRPVSTNSGKVKRSFFGRSRSR
jgi:hypothetical protein